jgi:hypothetical protein
MTGPERIAAACIIGAGGIVLGGVLMIRSFGCYALTAIVRVYREESALTRQSQELTRQSNWRTVDEIRANSAITTLAHERNLAVFNDAQRLRHELKDLIEHQRSA